MQKKEKITHWKKSKVLIERNQKYWMKEIKKRHNDRNEKKLSERNNNKKR